MHWVTKLPNKCIKKICKLISELYTKAEKDSIVFKSASEESEILMMTKALNTKSKLPKKERESRWKAKLRI